MLDEVGPMAVFVTNDFPPSHGGIQRLMARLAQEFALRDDSIVVVAPQQPQSERFDAHVNFRVSRYPGRGRFAGFAGMYACLLRARIAARRSLTIASMWFPGGLAACCVPRALRGRLVVLAHGTEIAPGRGGLRRTLMRYVFERADIVVANSTFTRDLLVAAGVRGAIAIVNPGIDAEPIIPDRAAVPTILSVGRLIARKGFDTVIGALPAIIERFPTTRYVIVGAGPQRDELVQLARRLGVADHIDFLGAVDDDAMRAAYARAWLFALPARTIGDDVEGFGVVYLEAALAQLPAIGGRSSGAQDAIVAGETGLLVDGNSSADLAEAVVTLFADRGRAAAMGLRGRDRALGYFTWQRAAAELAALTSMSTPLRVADYQRRSMKA